MVQLVGGFLFDEGQLEELEQAAHALYVVGIALDLVGEDVEDFYNFWNIFDRLMNVEKTLLLYIYIA